MDSKVKWHGRMSFTGTSDSGFELPLDSQKIFGGDDAGFRPMELIATGLAGCTAMDVISILTKKRQEVTDFEVRVHTERATEHPKVFTSALIEYIVTGHSVSEAALVRAIELSVTTYCSAQAMLSKVMPIALKYAIFEDRGDGQRLQIAGGSYPSAE